MRIRLGILRTRVARRILYFFLLCALLPVSVLSILSYYSVRNQLLAESRDRLHNMAKNSGLALAERFQFLENHARLVLVPPARAMVAGSPLVSSDWFIEDAAQGFEAALLVRPGGDPRPLFGEMTLPVRLDEEERKHLGDGLPLVRIRRASDGDPEVVMAFEIEPGDGPPYFLWTLLRSEYLWTSASTYSTLPTTAGFCFLEQHQNPLVCTLRSEQAFLRALSDQRGSVTRDPSDPSSTFMEWTDEEGEDFIAVTRDVFLRPQFFLPGLTVSASEARSSALSAMESFRTGFLGMVVVGLVLVAFLSNLQIRRSLDPLYQLKKGTQQLAAGEFGAVVSVSSRDEFEELADSFNLMATRLDSQFQTLETIGEIDRAILSALDSNLIIKTTLTRAGELIRGDRVAVCRLEGPGSLEGILTVSGPGTEDSVSEESVTLSVEEQGLLSDGKGTVTLDDLSQTRRFLGRGSEHIAISSAIVAPLQRLEGLAGYLSVGRVEEGSFSDAEVLRTEQIATQLSIALSNAWLLEELKRMSWGALTALARAIDAKSPWTSGHSERVAALSVSIGEGLGLVESDLTALQRGGLVHDIGKIAVPGRILDNDGPLTVEERKVIESHPEKGVRILEPIPAMREILPMVMHHHEALDGSGYPMGLVGEDIPLLARVMAVADQFDAMNSDRPYRRGLSLDETLSKLRRSAGRTLDEEVVKTFLALLEAGAMTAAPRVPVEFRA